MGIPLFILLNLSMGLWADLMLYLARAAANDTHLFDQQAKQIGFEVKPVYAAAISPPGIPLLRDRCNKESCNGFLARKADTGEIFCMKCGNPSKNIGSAGFDRK